MDQSYYALEILAKDRLDRARVDAGRRRLLRRAEVLPAHLRARLGRRGPSLATACSAHHPVHA